MNITKTLRKHRAYILNIRGVGVKANLCEANLCEANLCEANLSYADLSYANLRGANLSYADLSYANLCGANLSYSNLSYANLCEANLSYANLDFSSVIPFSCKGTNIKADDRLFSQMIYHLTRQQWTLTKENQKFLDSIPKPILNSFCNYRDDLEVM